MMRRGSGFEPKRLHGVGAVCLVVLLVLSAGAAGALAAGGFDKAAARRAATTEVRNFVKGQEWADAGRLGKCRPGSAGRFECDGVVRSKTRSCKVEVSVRAGAGRPSARLSRGKCQALAPPRAIRLGAQLDPNPVHNSASPFQVTYSFGATATTEIPGKPASSKPFPPPAGVLSFYSDGQLECTVKASKASPDSTCAVDYAAPGTHTLKATYIVGSKFGSAGMVYDARPFGTSFTLTAKFKPMASAGAFLPACPEAEPCELEAGLMENTELEIGTLEVTTSQVSPWGTQPISSCPETDPNCKLLVLKPDNTQTYPIWVVADLTINQNQMREKGEILDAEMGPPKSVEVLGAPGMTGIPVPEIEAGVFYFHTTSGVRPGFIPSEATAPIQFAPAAISPVRFW